MTVIKLLTFGKVCCLIRLFRRINGSNSSMRYTRFWWSYIASVVYKRSVRACPHMLHRSSVPNCSFVQAAHSSQKLSEISSSLAKLLSLSGLPYASAKYLPCSRLVSAIHAEIQPTYLVLIPVASVDIRARRSPQARLSAPFVAPRVEPREQPLGLRNRSALAVLLDLGVHAPGMDSHDEHGNRARRVRRELALGQLAR